MCEISHLVKKLLKAKQRAEPGSAGPKRLREQKNRWALRELSPKAHRHLDDYTKRNSSRRDALCEPGLAREWITHTARVNRSNIGWRYSKRRKGRCAGSKTRDLTALIGIASEMVNEHTSGVHVLAQEFFAQELPASSYGSTAR
jgi:hypothetical protein